MQNQLNKKLRELLTHASRGDSNPLKRLTKNQLIIISVVFVVFGFVVFRGGGNDNADQALSGEESTFVFTGTDSKQINGWAKLGTNDFGTDVLVWVFVITDGSIQNNGTCIDKVGTFCQDDRDGSRERLANTIYRYGLTIKSTEDNETIAAGSLMPIYCNKDQVLADLAQFYEKEYADRTDYNCGGSILANWKPTDSFIVVGKTSIDDRKDVLNPQALRVYDTHLKWSYTSESTETSLTNTIGPEYTYNEVKDQPFVKEYAITAELQ